MIGFSISSHWIFFGFLPRAKEIVMHDLTPWVIISFAASLILLSTILVKMVCSHYSSKQHSKPRMILLERIAPALTALVLSWIADVLLAYCTPVEMIHQRFSLWWDAWYSFFALVFVIRLIEGIAAAIYQIHGKNFPVPALLISIVRMLFLMLSTFLILKYVLCINIAPLLASTALVTAVVGFALQGVLGNLLAGMSLNIVRSVLPSDWICVQDVEGRVSEINWRETRLKTNDGRTMIIPNSIMASSVIHNMSWPDRKRRHELNVGASYADAPGDVIAALVASASAVPDVHREPAPKAAITAYEDFGINYRLVFWSSTFHDRLDIEGHVNRMIWYRFKRRGIEIPFPMSDQVLCDMMRIIQTQQHAGSQSETRTEQYVSHLVQSDFGRILLQDQQGRLMVDRTQLRSLIPYIKEQMFTRGEVLFRQGDAGSNCYIVLSGCIRLTVSIDAMSESFEIGHYALLGEMSLTTGLPRTATAVAKTDTTLLCVSDAGFSKLLSLHERIPDELAKLSSERAAQNSERMERMKLCSRNNLEQSITRAGILKRFRALLNLNA